MAVDSVIFVTGMPSSVAQKIWGHHGAGSHERSTPRRRCDGSTDTAVIPATGSGAPGTVIRRL
jgi:hypothetical protein